MWIEDSLALASFAIVCLIIARRGSQWDLMGLSKNHLNSLTVRPETRAKRERERERERERGEAYPYLQQQRSAHPISKFAFFLPFASRSFFFLLGSLFKRKRGPKSQATRFLSVGQAVKSKQLTCALVS